MHFNAKSIFLFDGLGALLSAAFTGIILPMLSKRLGVPSWVFYCLAVFPVTYGIYSMTCFWVIKDIKSWMLLTIIVANTIYCLISGAVIFTFDAITHLGRLLLTGEVLVILGVVLLEWSVYKKTSRS